MPAREAGGPGPARRPTGWTQTLLRFSSHRGVSLALAVAIALTDHSIHWQGLGFVPRALVDEPCHLATAVVVLGAFTRWRGRPPSRWFAWALLSASVLIDTDHLPLEFGSAVLTAGTPRPYTHALWVVAALAGAAAAARWPPVPGRAGAPALTGIFAGAAWGVGAHFLRDVATAPIALWWPVSSAGVQVPYTWYLVTLLVLAATPFPRRPGPAGGGGPDDGRQVQLNEGGRPEDGRKVRLAGPGMPASAGRQQPAAARRRGEATGRGRAGSGRLPTAGRRRSSPGASTGR